MGVWAVADYPIVMRQLNNSGEYDTLYPASTSDQIEGLLEETTKTAFGLSASAVPDDIFQKLANAITLNSTYGNLAVGSTVQLNVNGTPTNFIVVHQGNPDPSMYDESCNGTWLLMQDCYESRQWNNSDNNSYKASIIHTYLNDTFLNLFDADIREVIKQVKIPYVNGTGNSAVASGSSGLSCKIFLLSGREVGFSTSDNQYFPNDGAKLSYFESGTGSSALNKRIAKLNGSAAFWWLRSPCTSSTSRAWFVDSGGGYDGYGCTFSCGIRPCIIMPSGSLVLPNGTDVTTTISNILGISGLQMQIEKGAKIVTGSYVGTGTYGFSNISGVYVGFYPKWFVIYSTANGNDVWIFRCAAMKNIYQSGMYGSVANSGDLTSFRAGFVSNNGGGIRWYYNGSSSQAINQINTSGKTYYYFAIS